MVFVLAYCACCSCSIFRGVSNCLIVFLDYLFIKKPSYILDREGRDLMLAKEASEKDISELKKRLKEQQKQRILERDVKQVIDIVNRHSEKTS